MSCTVMSLNAACSRHVVRALPYAWAYRSRKILLHINVVELVHASNGLPSSRTNSSSSMLRSVAQLCSIFCPGTRPNSLCNASLGGGCLPAKLTASSVVADTSLLDAMLQGEEERVPGPGHVTGMLNSTQLLAFLFSGIPPSALLLITKDVT